MFLEPLLHKNPKLIKVFTGIRAEDFWLMIEKMESEFYEYELNRHKRDDRKRAIGAGRNFKQSLAQRTVGVLAYLRLNIPQTVIATMFGLQQCEISRDLRRLLPLIRDVLPCPEVWEVHDDFEVMLSQQLEDGQALIDATEQRVSRPGKNNEIRKLYYSGKQHEFTLKTQIVTDGNWHIAAVSVPAPGSIHDKKLCDNLQTLERLPAGCEAVADKGYQGLATDTVSTVSTIDVQTGVKKQVSRLKAYTPFKKTKGKELTNEQKAFNRALASIRIRVEHCIGWAKNWSILATRFRCSHSIYGLITQTICGLVNQQTLRWQMATGT
jgi:hypothetical protein